MIRVWSVWDKYLLLPLSESLESSCRHALPLFTSLLNIVCAYDPVGYGIPYNHLLFSDYREPLVEEAAQVLIVTLDYDTSTSSSPTVDGTTTSTAMDDVDVSYTRNLSHPCHQSLQRLCRRSFFQAFLMLPPFYLGLLQTHTCVTSQLGCSSSSPTAHVFGWAMLVMDASSLKSLKLQSSLYIQHSQ